MSEHELRSSECERMSELRSELNELRSSELSERVNRVGLRSELNELRSSELSE